MKRKHEKTKKLHSVKYEIRGPLQDRAKQLEAEGHKVIKLNIQFAKRVIELRNTVGQKLLTYDTLENSFAKNEIQILSMIKRVKDTRIKNIDEFKDKLQIILNKMK